MATGRDVRQVDGNESNSLSRLETREGSLCISSETAREAVHVRPAHSLWA